MNNTVMGWARLVRAILFLSTVVLVNHITATAAMAWAGFTQEGNSLVFRWGDCGKGDQAFYQLRPHQEGGPDAVQVKTNVCGYTIPNVSVGQIWIIALQRCSGTTLLGASKCSPWQEHRWGVAELPSDLQVLDESSWSGYTFTNRIRLRWRPGKALTRVIATGRRFIPGPPSYYDWYKQLDANATEVEVPVGRYERWEFGVAGLNPQGMRGSEIKDAVLGSISKTVDIIVPPPKRPDRLALAMRRDNGVWLQWRGDNITENFEIERLQWPSVASRLDAQGAKTFSDTGTAPPSGTQAIPQSRVAQGARFATGGGLDAKQASPTTKGITPIDPSAPQPRWVTVRRGVRTWGDTKHSEAIDDLRSVSAAVGGSVFEPYTYRVCAVAKSGRTCSDFAQVAPSTLRRELSTERLIK